MNDEFIKKLKGLPLSPGVYFHKNSAGEIVYIGKAAVLKNRVRQYFQKSRRRDPKTEALVSEIADTDWMEVSSEVEALFLEAEMVRRYMPKYNILLRDDKAMIYIKVDYDSDFPTVSTTRRPLDDGARYFGPYFSSSSVRIALKYLRKVFPYSVSRYKNNKRVGLHYHIGLDPGLEEGKTSLADYRKNLRRLMSVIEGKVGQIEKNIEKEMKSFSDALQFENAARARNQLNALHKLKQQIVFSDQEFIDISKDHALQELVELLGLTDFPDRIEGYDISHMSGTDVVASMVVFTNGASDKKNYRKFKTKYDHNNDFFNMAETIGRRLAPRNVKQWGLPKLLLIDGGKGQLDAAIKARDLAGHSSIPCIGLAKREEQVVVMPDKSNVAINGDKLTKMHGFATQSQNFVLLNLPHDSNLIKLLQRIRDESHRFAVSYHSTLKQNRQTRSQLDSVTGVGPVTKNKLLSEFGSFRSVKAATLEQIAEVVGLKRAELLYRALHDDVV